MNTNIQNTKSDLPVIQQVDDLFDKISKIIEERRRYALTAVNLAEVYSKFEIGKYIVEEEQNGKYRAQYGKKILESLSIRLTAQYGEGWSYRNLREFKQFYTLYSQTSYSKDDRIISANGEIDLASSVRQMRDLKMAGSVRQIQEGVLPKFVLSWSHYLILMRIKNADERRFYEIESQKQQWSYRQLSRQVGSSLYERLALSRDKDEVMRLATEGQTIEKPQDIIKIANKYKHKIQNIMSTIETDFRYYLTHQNELVDKYNGKYIVLADNKVVGSYEDYADAVYSSLEKYKPGTFMVQLCTPGESAYTARYYNRVTPAAV